MKPAHANTQEEESGGLQISGRVHTYRSDDQVSNQQLIILNVALSLGFILLFKMSDVETNTTRKQTMHQSSEQTRPDEVWMHPETNARARGEVAAKETAGGERREERRERESYLEYNLVVGGGGASHPESKLTGVALNVLRHP